MSDEQNATPTDDELQAQKEQDAAQVASDAQAATPAADTADTNTTTETLPTQDVAVNADAAPVALGAPSDAAAAGTPVAAIPGAELVSVGAEDAGDAATVLSVQATPETVDTGLTEPLTGAPVQIDDSAKSDALAANLPVSGDAGQALGAAPASQMADDAQVEQSGVSDEQAKTADPATDPSTAGTTPDLSTEAGQNAAVADAAVADATASNDGVTPVTTPIANDPTLVPIPADQVSDTAAISGTAAAAAEVNGIDPNAPAATADTTSAATAPVPTPEPVAPVDPTPAPTPMEPGEQSAAVASDSVPADAVAPVYDAEDAAPLDVAADPAAVAVPTPTGELVKNADGSLANDPATTADALGTTPVDVQVVQTAPIADVVRDPDAVQPARPIYPAPATPAPTAFASAEAQAADAAVQNSPAVAPIVAPITASTIIAQAPVTPLSAVTATPDSDDHEQLFVQVRDAIQQVATETGDWHAAQAFVHLIQINADQFKKALQDTQAKFFADKGVTE